MTEPLWTAVQSDALDWLKSQPTDSAALCCTSPPYTGARTYGIGAQRQSAEWVLWLRPIVVEMARVARIVALNISDQVRKFRYGCGDLWLIADLTRLDGLALGPAPYAWVRPGIPGSGGRCYHRREWEPVYVLARPKNLPPTGTDNTAFGKLPKYGPGGEMSNRTSDGSRVNQWGQTEAAERRSTAKSGRRTSKKPSHVIMTRKREGQHSQTSTVYDSPVVANPGNVIRTRNGGGLLGHPLAHENEAPMSLNLAERFVCWFCPPDGLVIDPFAGSGTTAHAAIKHGRRFAGCDLRQSQIDLIARRMATVQPELFT